MPHEATLNKRKCEIEDTVDPSQYYTNTLIPNYNQKLNLKQQALCLLKPLAFSMSNIPLV